MPQPQKISYADLGDMLQAAWRKGKIGKEAHDWIEAGLLPIHYLRDKLKWLIEKSDEEGYLNLTEY